MGVDLVKSGLASTNMGKKKGASNPMETYRKEQKKKVSYILPVDMNIAIILYLPKRKLKNACKNERSDVKIMKKK